LYAEPINPSTIVVCHSGGKDSTMLLVEVVRRFAGKCRIIVHHQYLPEAWEGTVEYVRETCDRFGLELVVEQAYYIGYHCADCGKQFLYAKPPAHCPNPKCRSENFGQVAEVRSLTDLIRWRGMWPSPAIRFCTSYLKRDLLDKWLRRNRAWLGDCVIVAMGERWLESPQRSKLPYLKPRSESLQWVTEWRPILHWRRREIFRGLRAAGIEPHPAYKLQGMTEQQMYEEDQEGGPRCSCVVCIYMTPEQIQTAGKLEINRVTVTQLYEIEDQTGFTWREGLGLRDIIENGKLKADKPEQAGQLKFNFLLEE
jgi:3'-phosphoadenosine 5'-phosphosulfate sulfotransferase (PAPS reductase)/FAD synthetase